MNVDVLKIFEDGWLGSMYQGRYDADLVRLHDIKETSTAIKHDLEARIKTIQAVDIPNVLTASISEGYYITSYKEALNLQTIFTKGLISSDGILFSLLSKILHIIHRVYNSGIIHGDLSPEVIYVGRDGHIYIEGYGRKIDSDVHPHTNHHRYLSPETHSSLEGDIYSVGIMILEFLQGYHIRIRESTSEAYNEHLEDIFDELNIKDGRLYEFLKKSLSFEPSNRKNIHFLFLEEDNKGAWEIWCSQLPSESPREEISNSDFLDAVFYTEETMEIPEFNDLETSELTEELLPSVSKLTPKEKIQPNSVQADQQKKYLLAIGILGLLIIIATIVF